MGIADADSGEHDTSSQNLIIAPVACPIPGGLEGAPKLSGASKLRIKPGGRLASIYGACEIEEEYFCNFEVNPEYEWCAMEAGFPVVARGSQGEIRAIESPAHRFFIATLFQPQLFSTEKNPHPLVMAFVQAAAVWTHQKLDDAVLE